MSEKLQAGNPATLLKKLIQCPSVTPKEAGALDIVEAYLEPLGFSCTRLAFEGDGSYPVDNLFATRGANGRHLLFGGHVDVVPPGDENQWKYDPFSAKESQGMIWGRGAVDMKSGVAAFCAAAARFIDQGHADEGTISLAITADEEADAINGTKKILQWAEKQGHRFDFAIVGEPSSGQVLGDSIKIGRRGSLSGLIVVKGKQGHSAYPDRANNPVPVLAQLANALVDVPLDEGTDHFQASNVEVTSVDVGNKVSNVIPAEGRLNFNIRFNDHWNAKTIDDWVDQRIAELNHRGTVISWSKIGAVAESFVSPLSGDIETLQGSVKKITGRVPELATFGGTSDARFIARYCPVVECGLVGTTMHEVDERVEVQQVDDLSKIYSEFLRNFF